MVNGIFVHNKSFFKKKHGELDLQILSYLKHFYQIFQKLRDMNGLVKVTRCVQICKGLRY